MNLSFSLLYKEFFNVHMSSIAQHKNATSAVWTRRVGEWVIRKFIGKDFSSGVHLLPVGVVTCRNSSGFITMVRIPAKPFQYGRGHTTAYPQIDPFPLTSDPALNEHILNTIEEELKSRLTASEYNLTRRWLHKLFSYWPAGRLRKVSLTDMIPERTEEEGFDAEQEFVPSRETKARFLKHIRKYKGKWKAFDNLVSTFHFRTKIDFDISTDSREVESTGMCVMA